MKTQRRMLLLIVLQQRQEREVRLLLIGVPSSANIVQLLMCNCGP